VLEGLTLAQFSGMFCRNDVSCRWVVQVFLNNQTFIPCTMLDARRAINSLVQMVVVIHAFLFVQCFIFPNSVILTISSHHLHE